MKFLLWCLLTVWCALVLEMTFSDVLPRGAMFVPLVGAILLWAPTVRGLMTGGLLLLLDWIARPTLLPVVPFLIPVLATAMVAVRGSNRLYQQPRVRMRLPEAFQLPCLVAIAMLCDQLSQIPINTWQSWDLALWGAWQKLQPVMLVAIPLSAGLALLMKLAEETGLRRVTT